MTTFDFDVINGEPGGISYPKGKVIKAMQLVGAGFDGAKGKAQSKAKDKGKE